MTHLTIKHSAWSAALVLLLLVLTACGAGASTGGAGQAPGGPDTSVSGQPGDPAGKPTGAVVEGVVTDAAGKPVAGAVVMPKSADTPPQAVPEKAVFTDEQGRYTWTLSPGKYTFSISHNGAVMETEAVTVTEAQPAKLDVALK